MIQCMVVDEDDKDRQAVSTLLSGYGFRLVDTSNATHALKLCREDAPDVVVLADRIGMTRRDVIVRARKNSRGKRPVFLIYTASNDTGDIGQAILDGAAECLVKPFDRELLEFKLRQVGLL